MLPRSVQTGRRPRASRSGPRGWFTDGFKGATPPTIAAKQAMSVIPIVFVGSGDSVGSGLVASLARPGSNVTGLSIQSVDAVSKRVELLRDVVPNLRRLAVLVGRLLRGGGQSSAKRSPDGKAIQLRGTESPRKTA